MGHTDKIPENRRIRSLSTKLLALVIACILVAEAVVLIPSIAYHRVVYLQDRIEAAFLISLAYESPYGEIIDQSVSDELFATAGVKGVSSLRNGRQALIFAPEIQVDFAEGSPPPINHFIDLREGWSLERFIAPWATLFSSGDELIRATGMARFASEGSVSVLVSQAAMREDLWRYAGNVFALSLIISSLAGLFVYVRLAQLIVDPVKALSENMMAFELDPEGPENVLVPSERDDEIGVAEKSLSAMERRTQTLLSERRRLAALGAGISKISHDLRNVLASAQLMSDRLASSEDPRVAKLAPRLLASLDRAVALSRDTLSFARMAPENLKLAPVRLRPLVDEVLDDAARMAVEHRNETPEGVVVLADPTHLYRAIFNLVKNAAEAIEPTGKPAMAAADDDAPPAILGRISVSAQIVDGMAVVSIEDNGPGLPDLARAQLFEPFKGSLKPGGSGLGVAIAAEIAKAHGGRLELSQSDASGTIFAMRLPLAGPVVSIGEQDYAAAPADDGTEPSGSPSPAPPR